jgi:hypothetical protein
MFLKKKARYPITASVSVGCSRTADMSIMKYFRQTQKENKRIEDGVFEENQSGTLLDTQ